MELACPGHRFLGVAELRDHRLAFTRRSLLTGTGVADILAAPGQSVWGALYALDDAQLAAIDEKEGNGWAYERRAVRVIATRAGCGDPNAGVSSGEELDAFAYFVIAPDAEHVRPSREYLRALLDGARERGLPDAYVAALRATVPS
jgi:gamma-glutamylcyclotransferase